MLTGLWGWVGFYLVRGTVQRDFDTRVWQSSLGTTSMRRSAYLLDKWASHLVVMGALLAATLVVGLVAQWVRAEDRHIDLWELVKPSLFIALPILAVSAALAIWFDIVPVLRRTAGNAVFFFVWITLLTTGPVGIDHDRDAQARRPGARRTTLGERPAGHARDAVSIEHQVARSLPEKTRLEGFCLGGGGVTASPVRFAWTTWEVRAGGAVGGACCGWSARSPACCSRCPARWGCARAATPSAGGKRHRGRCACCARCCDRCRPRPPACWWPPSSSSKAHAAAVVVGRLAAVVGSAGVRNAPRRRAGDAGSADAAAGRVLAHRPARPGARAPWLSSRLAASGGPRRLLVARSAAVVGLAWLAVAPGLGARHSSRIRRSLPRRACSVHRSRCGAWRGACSGATAGRSSSPSRRRLCHVPRPAVAGRRGARQRRALPRAPGWHRRGRGDPVGVYAQSGAPASWPFQDCIRLECIFHAVLHTPATRHQLSRALEPVAGAFPSLRHCNPCATSSPVRPPAVPDRLCRYGARPPLSPAPRSGLAPDVKMVCHREDQVGTHMLRTRCANPRTRTAGSPADGAREMGDSTLRVNPSAIKSSGH